MDGVCTHAFTTRSQETFCPDVAPAVPTDTALTRRRPCAERIVDPANTGNPSGQPPSERRSTTVTSAPASFRAQAVV